MSFTYKSSKGTHRVECDLECRQCSALKSNGEQCKHRTCKYLPFCSGHLKSKMHLTIKKSVKIPAAGFGLYTLKNLKAGDKIAEYFGKTYSKGQIDEMYGNAKNDFGPYTFKQHNQKFVDSACTRSTAAFANAFPGKNNAKFSVSHNKGTVTMKATKPIKAGEEVFVSYGPSYFRNNLQERHPEFKTMTRKRGKKFPAFLK